MVQDPSVSPCARSHEGIRVRSSGIVAVAALKVVIARRVLTLAAVVPLLASLVEVAETAVE